MTVTPDDITDAAIMLNGRILRTPTLPAPALRELTGVDIYLKFENLQITSAFKVRGALVKLASLSEAQRAAGVIALSAGNHAQAVAYFARDLEIPATIVMPTTTPFVKVERTRSMGADVVLSGETLVECQAAYEDLIAARALTPIHPYDDDHVIAGQGTIAHEMLEDAPAIDTLVVPVGGGGLIAGVSIAAKAIRPDIDIFGAETALYPAMHNAFHGQTAACGGNTLAEGIAVKNVAERTTMIARDHVTDILLASETDIERAVNALLTVQKTTVEGAGAAGLAAVMADPGRFRDRTVGLILCGGNIDPRILASIVYRELERESRIVSLRIQTPDRPGVLGHIASCLGEAGANILEVSHHRLFLDVPAKGTELELMIETRDRHHAKDVIETLNAEGYAATTLDAPGGKERQ